MRKTIVKKLLFIFSMTFSALLVVINAEAKDSSLYIGIGGGSTQFNGDKIYDIAFLPGQRLDDDTEQYNIYLGYQLNKYFSFELRYVDFGKATKRYLLDPDIIFLTPPNDTVSIEADGFTISSLFEYPVIDRFRIFGIIGISYLDVDRNIYPGNAGPGTNILSYSSANSEGEILYGAGLRYELTDCHNIRFQWEHYDIDTSEKVASPNLKKGAEVDVVGVSLEYSF